MATLTQESRFDLVRHELVSFSGARDLVLSCVAGELWITVDGDGRDIILVAGKSWHIDSDAEVVVSALQAAAVTLRRNRALAPLSRGTLPVLLSLRKWKFPPLAAFPSPLIR